MSKIESKKKEKNQKQDDIVNTLIHSTEIQMADIAEINKRIKKLQGSD